MKNNKFNKKETEVNTKMSTQSILYSDKLYPMFDVYLCVCVCMCVGRKREKITHAQYS